MKNVGETPIFSVDIVCNEELNLMLKVIGLLVRCGGFELKS